MGGAMAAIVAALSLGPIAVSPCLGTWTGAGVYTDGGLAPQVAWRVLAAERGGSRQAARAWVRSVHARSAHPPTAGAWLLPRLLCRYS
jgi:hypothetical protein